MKDEYEVATESDTIENIKAIYDNGGKTIDRYTIVFNKKHDDGDGYLALRLSEDPLAPHGVSGWCEVISEENLGEEVRWEGLPESSREHIIGRWTVDR